MQYSMEFYPTRTSNNPTGHYILIKRSEQTLYYVKGKLLLKSFPVATGRDASPTPTGRFTVVYKEENRPFYKGNIAGGASNNPLGTRWLGLNIHETAGNTYGIHGTNQVGSIGMKVSAGCIRMKNADVEWLYDRSKRNTCYYSVVKMIIEKEHPSWVLFLF